MKIEVVWEQLVGRGSEHLILQVGNRIEADGLAVGVINETAYRLQYHIVCDIHWNVERLQGHDLLSHKRIDLAKKPNGDWIDEMGHTNDALSGCTDVDIMVTPFTNSLPIRRMKLALGESKEISLVYVSIPDLNISRLGQRYTYLTRLEKGGIYKYENMDGSFTSDITADQDGLVVDYPGIFKQVWKRIDR